MTAAEKRKMVANQLLELLSPYGYFQRHGSVWKYSPAGKFVVCIFCDFSRDGSLLELNVSFGSFFAPIEPSNYFSKRLFLHNNLELAYYVRNVSSDRPLLDCRLPFETQVEVIMKHFREIILPVLPIHDELADYLPKAEKMRQMTTTANSGLPYGQYYSELCLAYLSLNKPEESLRVALAYAEQCLYASQYIENNPVIFRYDIEKRVNFWRQERNDALTLAQSIQSDNGRSFHSVVEQRESGSFDLCNHFFKIKNRKK